MAGVGVHYDKHWKGKVKHDLCPRGANRPGSLAPSLLSCLPRTYLEPHPGFVDFHGPHAGLTERSQTLGPTLGSAFYSQQMSPGRLFLRKLNLPAPYLPTLQMREPIPDSLGCFEHENRQFIQQVCLGSLIISVGAEKTFDKSPYTVKFKQINNLFLQEQLKLIKSGHHHPIVNIILNGENVSQNLGIRPKSKLCIATFIQHCTRGSGQDDWGLFFRVLTHWFI